jgi:hypothetical protein
MSITRLNGWLICLATILSCTFALVTSLRAETYVGGQIGMTLPQPLSNGEVTQNGIGGLTIDSDQALKNSIMLGAKLGHYFSKARWIGVETGLSFANPHIKQGSLTLSGPGGTANLGTFAGVYQRMIIWDIATLMFRYPKYRLQPYIGAGPALFFGKLTGPTAPPGQSATNIGVNVEGGARYYITRRWALFGEAQYHWARMNYSSNANDPTADPFAFKANYGALNLSLGVSFHF